MAKNEQYLITDGGLIEDIEPTEEQMAFDKFRDEMADSETFSKMLIFRQPMTKDNQKAGKKLIFLFDCALDQFDYSQLLSYVRDNYAGGTYRIQGRSVEGKLMFNRTFQIEVPKTSPLPNTGIGGGSESASELISTVQQMIENSQRQTMEMMQRFLPAKEITPKDPMEQMGVIMGLMVQMKDFFSGGKSEPVSLLAEIEKHKAIAGLFGSGAETNESDVWVKLAEQFAPAIVDAMGVGQGMPQLSGPDTPAIVSGAPAPGAAVVATVSGAGVAELKKETPEMLNLKTQAAALYGAAKNGIAPEKMANTILNLTPDEKIEDLYAFMNDEHCVQTFVDTYPPLQAYTRWLEQVQVSILGELVRDDFKEPGAEEILHSGELIGADEKELTDTENKPKIAESEKATPKKVKAKAKSKSKASKKGATQSSKSDN